VPSRVLCLLLAALSAVACQPDASRRGATVLFASGADLQSINPLLTLHPLARQVQRYVLLTTLARYDSALVPAPYLAREWRWSDGDRTLTLRLHSEARWHDGRLWFSDFYARTVYSMGDDAPLAVLSDTYRGMHHYFRQNFSQVTNPPIDSLRERNEARAEVALSAVLAAFSMGLLGHWWLRARVRDELRPLDRLSDKLEHHDPLDRSHALGAAERAELAPVHAAIDQLGQRLARRVAHERAFAAHAAHALRTPLAGMEAQLAVALRESTPAVQQRLQRVREASGRLQRVVQSLLDLFRVGADVQRSAVDLKALLAHLPVEGLEVSVHTDGPLQADPDLLAAALANLLDNAKRHGARRVSLSQPVGGTLRVQDDGPGVAAERLQALRAALREQTYDGSTGLGLMLADLVARSHGGALSLPDVDQGFAVDLNLGAPG